MTNLQKKKRTFITLRYVLIVAGAYLFLCTGPDTDPPALISLLVALALGSNVLLAAAPPARVLSLLGLIAVVAVDLIWISAGLLLSTHVGPDLLILYLLVLVAAAAGESLLLVTSTALMAGIAYLAVLGNSGGTGSLLTSANLMRLPFLFAAALACGYLVNELKRERRHSEDIERLESMRAEALSAAVKNLQSPLHMMALGLEDLQKTGVLRSSPGRVKKDLNEVVANLEYMSLLLDNYLDLAKLRAGSPASVEEPVDVAALVGLTIARFTPFAEVRGVELLHSTSSPPPILNGDAAAISHILGNLVHNAIKFNRRGGKVEVEAHAVDEGVELSVSDTGWGIPPEERLSLPFLGETPPETVDANPTRLGLHTVTRLAELHGGSVLVESQAQEGSRFSIRLPQSPPVCGHPPGHARSSDYDGFRKLLPRLTPDRLY